MEKLWAPWRMAYINGAGSEGSCCIFCTKPKRSTDREDLILFRGVKSFVIMNLYPYNNGHLMVVPYHHTADVAEIDKETSAELWDLQCRCRNALRDAFHPAAFNIGMNLGRVAGAGIDTHLHIHIVPRWNGDTNFMPVLGDTKVISQGIFDTYDALLPYFRTTGAISTGAVPGQ